MQVQTPPAGATVAIGAAVCPISSVVDIDCRRLEEAPSYNALNTPDWSDRAYRQRVDTHYSVPPYDF
jgi:hypothetical protein